jgi:hypothetical protein
LVTVDQRAKTSSSIDAIGVPAKSQTNAGCLAAVPMRRNDLRLSVGKSRDNVDRVAATRGYCDQSRIAEIQLAHTWINLKSFAAPG